MARLIHPLTGVELNPIPIERTSLNFEEAVTAWLMRLQRAKYHTIAMRLGTNTHRLGEVFRGEVHITAEAAARTRLYR
ncbi:MAG TPA: hypothetical protein DHV56_09220 [Rhodobacter sp.]|nr:hypothetical protein [Rhodobacter sp.]